jgi:hypothetical protein
MAENQIFYSEVDPNLKDELNARGRAGMRDRSTAALDYMLSKISNVELVAYKNKDVTNVTSTKDPADVLYTLGGKSVQSGEYLPNGFLDPNRSLSTIDNRTGNFQNGSIFGIAAGATITEKKNNTYKIPPVITDCNISMNDHTIGLLNSATVEILIPNPDQDLDFMESVFARPGRAVTLKIEQAENAVITRKKLSTTSVINPKLPDTPEPNLSMNRYIFDGLVISFGLSYQTDGSVRLTLHLKGTSSVYTDITLLTKEETEKKAGETVGPEDFYAKLMDELKTEFGDNVQLATQANDKLSDTFELKHNNDRWYFVTNDTLHDQQTRYYIMLGELIHRLNKYISAKQNIAARPYVIFTDAYCFSNTYDELVSCDPLNILIPGIHSVYGKQEGQYRYYSPFVIGNALSNVKFETTQDNLTVGCPSRIFINTTYIDTILKELKGSGTTYKLKDFLTKLSEKLTDATQGAINLQLIPHPSYPDYLLFYDSQYLGAKQIQPYSVPMMANHENGTIVTDFQFTAKLPTSVQNLMYSINNNDEVSEEQIAPYMNFMYNNITITRSGNNETINNNGNNETLKKLEESYKKSHTDKLTSLQTAKQNFGDKISDNTLMNKLEFSLKKYLQYPLPKINDSIKLQSPVYPYEVDFTIDGINGFRYGDTLKFDMLPQKYKNNTTFSIISTNHTVNTNGEWKTKIRCIMRPSFN